MSATPEPAFSGELVLIQIIVSLLSIFLVAVQAYLVYRVDRARLKIEKFSGIGEKCGLDVQPLIQGENIEAITITNNGTIPIDEMIVKIDLLVERRKETSLPFSVKWSTNAFLSPKEATTIPLHEKLWPFLEQNHLARIVEEQIGPDPEDMMYTASLEKQFSIMLDIQVNMTVQKEVTTIRKKYSLHYSWKDKPTAMYEDDYIISTSQYMGEWIK